jgi:hypothetical protein
MIRKKRSLCNLNSLSLHWTGVAEENHKNLSDVCRSPGQDFNPEPPVYEADVLTTRPRRSL